MPHFKVYLSAALVVLVACGSESRAPELPDFMTAFPNLALPAQAELVSRSGSKDALQLTLRTPADEAHVISYYRDVLSAGNWRLVGDSKNPDGSTVLYAEQDGPPLWVRIWKGSDSAGTMVQLTGAVPTKDSATSHRRADTSSKRR
jgi:hypothetical protein